MEDLLRSRPRPFHRHPVPVLMLVAVVAACVPAGATATVPADTGLRQRQQRALTRVAQDLVADRSYAGTDCRLVGPDANGLVAALELGRRGLPGGITSQAAAEPAAHIAAAIFSGQGTATVAGTCSDFAVGPVGSDAALALAYALHRYGSAWPAATKDSIRHAIEDAAWPFVPQLQNRQLPIPAAALLAGEALGRSALLQRGLAQLDAIFQVVRLEGGIELNSPSYSAWHFPPLIFLQEMQNAQARTEARLLLEYELLWTAHLYLPGGVMGAPQSRDYAGGAADEPRGWSIHSLWLLIGDPQLSPDLTHAAYTLAAAATDYAVPEIIRSIFLDKGTGYSFSGFHQAQQGPERTPYAVVRTPKGGEGFPIQGVMLPNGAAMLGVGFGWYWCVHQVSDGTYVRLPSGGFAILYQHEPLTPGDTAEDGSAIAGTGLTSDTSSFTGELYDVERMVYHRTALALYDPRPRSGVVRNAPYTQVHVPKLAAQGGETTWNAGWWVQRSGEVYLAYRPFGTIQVNETRDGGSWTYLRIPGVSGAITEVATTAEYPDLASYVRELTSRTAHFDTNPLALEVDGRDASMQRVRLRLEYRPERRLVNGSAAPNDGASYLGLMDSPWVRWNASTQQLTVARDGYTGLTYDWASAAVTSGAQPTAPAATPVGTPGRPETVIP